MARIPRPTPLLTSLVLLLTLAACLPASRDDATPDAAVLAVPADRRVPGAADELHARLEDLPTGHELVGRSNLAFLEVRSGLTGSRVASGAARVARNAGAEVAVTIGAGALEREVTGPERAPREEAELRLEATLIRASDGTVLARLRGERLTGERRLGEAVLPPLDEDPLVRDLAERGLETLAPRVAAELASLSFSGSSVE